MKNNKLVYGWFDGEECFYIGMGSQRRSRSRESRNPHCLSRRKISEKNKCFQVQIFETELTRDEACELEKELIEKYGRRDLGTGTLTNMTDGGEGCNYWREKTRSQATKDKISVSLRGNTNGKGRKNKTGNQYWKGKPASEQPKSKSVTTDIGTFDAMWQACVALGITYHVLKKRIKSEDYPDYFINN